MQKKRAHIHIGLRTIKTCLAVGIAMWIVSFHGASASGSKLIFAMLGAMAAVMPTFRESLESCLSQILFVIIGSCLGIIMRHLPIPTLVACTIGVFVVITIYSALFPRYIPNMACFVVVMLCTTPDIQTFPYAMERIWDTTIGLLVGLTINTLVLPYDNSNKILDTIESLERELIHLLEELFDGDDVVPNPEAMLKKLKAIGQQLDLFSKQKLVLHLRRQKQQLETYRKCENNARILLARMQVLCSIERPGRLNDDNRRRLAAAGAVIRDNRPLDSVQELDVVTNYHVAHILTVRTELMQVLHESRTMGKRKKK